MQSSRSILVTALCGLAVMAAAPPTRLASDGLPPLRFGMTPQDAERALGKPLTIDYSDASKACGQVLDPRYRTTSLMFVEGRLARVDVQRRGLGFRGLSVGSTVKAVRAVFPTLTTEPHKYTDGSYLIAKLPGGTRAVFETDKQRVTRFRVGTFPAVEFVEGCY